MLEQLIRSMTPEMFGILVKNNPHTFLSILQNFRTFQLFGKLLTEEQQIIISKNLAKTDEFLKSEQGKDSVSIMIEEFCKFVNTTHS